MSEGEAAAAFTYRVCDLPARMRPREMFERLGPGGMTDAALIALILRTGRAGQNVVRLAEDLLVRHGSLANLARTPLDELVRTWAGSGLGVVKLQMLQAALELGRRLNAEARGERPAILTPEDAARLLYDLTRDLDREIFYLLPLDTRNQLLGEPLVVTSGILNASLVHPREVFKLAVTKAAASILVAHNHPSGDPTPSREDIRITGELVQAGRVLGIKLMDHVIVGLRRDPAARWFTSLRESGLVLFED
jgi:DNA repair protein RadC